MQAIPQGTSVPPATETATPGSGYTVIQDPAQIPSPYHRLFEMGMPPYLLICKFFAIMMNSSPKGQSISRCQCSPTGDIFRIKSASNFASCPNRNVYRIVVEKLQL